jgi:hypothetical protein
MVYRTGFVVSYFTSRDLGPNTGDVECVDSNKGCLHGAGMLDVDQPVEFVFGEACMQQLPIFVGCVTSETMGPISVGFDPDSGSNIGVQLTQRVNTGGRQMNLNITCITRVLPNPAIGRQITPTLIPLDTISRK